MIALSRRDRPPVTWLRPVSYRANAMNAARLVMVVSLVIVATAVVVAAADRGE
jgi:hypothetical protein